LKFAGILGTVDCDRNFYDYFTIPDLDEWVVAEDHSANAAGFHTTSLLRARTFEMGFLQNTHQGMHIND
jgi:hypothetical protein